MRKYKEKIIKEYLARIGSLGGRKSRRLLTPEQAREMVKAREAKKLHSADGGEKEQKNDVNKR